MTQTEKRPSGEGEGCQQGPEKVNLCKNRAIFPALAEVKDTTCHDKFIAAAQGQEFNLEKFSLGKQR